MKTLTFRLLIATSLFVACANLVSAQTDNTKKKPAPPPAKAAPAPAKPAAPAARPAAPAASAVLHPGGAAAPSSAGTVLHPAAPGGVLNRPGVPSQPVRNANVAGPGRPGGATPVAMRPPSPMNRPAPRDTHELHGAHGEEVRMGAGRRGPVDVNVPGRGVYVHRNLVGNTRHVELARPGGGRMVIERGRPNFIGHPYMSHGHEFERRAYYDHGRAYNRFYRPYGYHGYNLRVYAPARYYPGAYYGWAYHPWGAPVRYAGWGYAGRPWYGAYGGYFQPYPVYASPALWITDYMVAQTLSAGYQARLEGDPGAPPVAYAGPPMPEQAKQAMATEVQSTIALENQEASQNQQQVVPDPASSGIARLMSDGKPHAFLAGKEVDVVDNGGLECAVTDGDVIQFSGPLSGEATMATVTVLSSKGGKECARGAQITIALDELQEMNNHLREQVDAGLQQLAAQQGSNGLPAAPASALGAPTDALVAQGAPPPDPNGAQEIAKGEAESQQVESEALKTASTTAPASTGDEDLFKPKE